MRQSFFLTILGALVLLAGCNDAAKPPVSVQSSAPASPASRQHDHKDDGHDAPRISLADAKKAYDDGTGVIVDVRDKGAYNVEHIKNALHLPLADVTANIDKLPKGKKIIVYCS
jgi:hypothetical protein